MSALSIHKRVIQRPIKDIMVFSFVVRRLRCFEIDESVQTIKEVSKGMVYIYTEIAGKRV